MGAKEEQREQQGQGRHLWQRVSLELVRSPHFQDWAFVVAAFLFYLKLGDFEGVGQGKRR